MKIELPPPPRVRVVHWADSQQELQYLTPEDAQEYTRAAVLVERERAASHVENINPSYFTASYRSWVAAAIRKGE